ncbi:hypothetical protein MRX96_028222 [Rhipicephalus microplus]
MRVKLVLLGGVRVTALARGIGRPPVSGFSKDLHGLMEWVTNKKALVEELGQRKHMADVVVNAQQADAQPTCGKRKAADPPVDFEKEFSDFELEITGVIRKIRDAIAGVSSVI